MSQRRGEVVAGLDIGTTKTCTVVAQATPDGFEIIGVGEAPSAGLRRGVVTDLEETIRSIEAATERAERMAGVHVSEVFVGVTGDHVKSTNNRGVVAISGEEREVQAADVRRVVEASKLINVPPDRQIIHALPRHFMVDGQDGVIDPVGLAGQRLEVDTHIITGGNTFITNVLKCVHRAGLAPAGIVFEPLASSAATLMPEERQIGVAMLDIGGGTTDIAVFSGGGAVHSSTIPIGGNILTNDIALGLKTTTAEAEAIKRTYGTAGDLEEGGESSFTVRTLDGRTTRMVSRAQLRSIVLPRITEIFRLAKQQIAENTPRDLMLAEVVLAGGGAHLRGIESVAAEFFGVPVRIGVPQALGGLTEAVRQPQFATAVGLIIFGPGVGQTGPNGRRRSGALTKVANWFGDLWN